MEKLYVFGTGNALVTRCYNTCFALRDEDQYFMVDTGGGNGILRILAEMQVPVEAIHHIFITHAHTDHLLGIVWIPFRRHGHEKGNLRRRFKHLLSRGAGGDDHHHLQAHP